MKTKFLLLFLFFALGAGAQPIQELTKTQLEKKIRESYPGTEIFTTDTTLIYSIFAENQHFTKHIYHFPSVGTWTVFHSVSSKDSLYRKVLENCLAEKKYGWKKINGNQYVSKYRRKLLLETDPDSTKYSFRIIRTRWTRKAFKMLGN